MTVTRLGNVALYNNTLKDVSDVQKRLATLQQQISSGLKANDFAGLSGQVEQFTLLDAKMRTSEQYIQSNQLNISRMKTADQAMAQIVDIADDMENLIVQARSGAVGQSLNLPQLMTAYLNQLGSAMNMNFEGRYLFGGTATASAPVSGSLVNGDGSGIPSDFYYTGSKDNLVYSQEERFEYEFPVRADDPGFQKIIAAANMAMQAVIAGSDSQLAAAVTLMQQGQADVNSARSNLNNTIISVQQTTDRIESLKLYWKGVSEEVSKTDLVSATTEVANNEAILQAAFQVFSRLSQLKLSDYL